LLINALEKQMLQEGKKMGQFNSPAIPQSQRIEHLLANVIGNQTICSKSLNLQAYFPTV
jgi:hypothetical protein